jgi:hypothetical protein
VYSGVILKFTTQSTWRMVKILRISKEFQSKEWFSDVAVTLAEDQEQYNSDEGSWYGKVSVKILKNIKYVFCLVSVFNGFYLQKVLLIFKFFQGSFKEPYELALIHWYDIIPEPELYGCP